MSPRRRGGPPWQRAVVSAVLGYPDQQRCLPKEIGRLGVSLPPPRPRAAPPHTGIQVSASRCPDAREPASATVRAGTVPTTPADSDLAGQQKEGPSAAGPVCTPVCRSSHSNAAGRTATE